MGNGNDYNTRGDSILFITLLLILVMIFGVLLWGWHETTNTQPPVIINPPPATQTVPIPGPKGDTGPRGDRGPVGPQGTTPAPTPLPLPTPYNSP